MSRPVDPRTFCCTTQVSLLDFLASFQFPIDSAFLLKIGAVYLNRERIFRDRMLLPGDWIRVHSDPRRFPVHTIDWTRTVRFQNADFVIIHKPPGIPIHPTCDNFEENVLRQCERLLNLPLGITHRLDVGTEGLVLFAKTQEFLRAYNREIQARRIEKGYRALTRRAPPLGSLIHFMEPGARAPRRVSDISTAGSKRCELEVLSVQQIAEELFESEIRLHSGRHHQIRAQFAAVGSPIIGDSLYGSDTLYNGLEDALALLCCTLGFVTPSGENFRFLLETPFPRFSALKCLQDIHTGDPCHASL